MALHGVVVCRTATEICGIIFGHTTMAIGSIVFFNLTATGIVFRCSTLVVGIVVFRHTTPLLVICHTTTAMRDEHNNQPKEGCMAEICLTAAMDDGSVSGNDGKDVRAMTVMMPVQQGCWHGHNNGEDASNRGKVLGNNQPAQQKDKRADKRSGVEDMAHSRRGVR
jgi:hypothetical protein